MTNKTTNGPLVMTGFSADGIAAIDDVRAANNGDTFTVRIPFEIDVYKLDCLIANAIEFGAIRGWCKRATGPDTVGGAYTLTLVDDGGKLPIVKNALSRWTILQALPAIAAQHPKHFADWVTGKDDAHTVDVFVQMAVLGEVVYG